MGLMLSVLVFCVGVAEVLDCWDHLLLHLVQPQYNYLPRHEDSKSDYLSDREFQPLSESRRPSKVDICWPKDLSPDDNLHVIKKRSHEVDQESPHRAVRKASPLTTQSKIAESISPDIEVHISEVPDSSFSPPISRETSPDRLELCVIEESDTSSEVDEPSQIENLNYKKDNHDENVEEELNDLCSANSLSLSATKDVGIPRPKTPRPKELEDDSETTFESETSSFPLLPVFTDNILLYDVKRVIVHNPPVETKSVDLSSSSCDVQFTEDINISIGHDVDSSKPSTESSNGVDIQPISLILDEDLEPIPEFPEIKVHNSSPIPEADDSDSSLNTSDASWMVKSKTSDRPLVIRFDSSPEQIEHDFQSVVDTNLRALGDQKHDENKGLPSRSLQKADSVDIYYDALVNQHFENGQTTTQQNASLEEVNEVLHEADFKPSAVHLMQIDNSSSSSLSGIPPIPEDTFESLTQSSLAADNGFSQGNDFPSTDLSYSQSDNPPTFFLTSDASDDGNISIYNQTQNISEEVGDANMIQNVYTESFDVQSNGSKNISETASDLINSQKENVSLSNVNVKDIVICQTRHPLGAIEQIQSSNSASENLVCDQKTTGKLSKDQDLVQASSQSNESSENANAISIQQLEPEETDRLGTTNKLQAKDSCLDESNKNDTKEALATTQVSTCSTTDPLTEDKPKIPCEPSENITPQHVPSKTLDTPKNHTKKVKTKQSSKSVSVDSGDTPASSGENISNEEILPGSASFQTMPELKTNASKTEPAATAGPSKSHDEAGPSTSKEHDKAFWLIFSGEYTKAMNKDWHSGHFCCWQCDESLTGQRYVLRDEHPYCVKCYESVFANGCDECNKTIGIDSKDLSYKDKHWHEACFLCNKCHVSLVDKQFGSKLDKIFCSNCFDQQFASRCDACGQIFKAGTKKMEYKTRQWHEPCFSCCVCKSPIGTKSFIPREQEIYCANCYEEKFATRCVKCNKVITSGGVTYKNEPWHRDCFTCTNCNTSLAGQRFTSRDEKPYCAECFGELFAKRCTACSKPITGIGGTRFISFEDRHWHNDCFICASCKTSLVGRGFITDADDIICPDCAKQKLM